MARAHFSCRWSLLGTERALSRFVQASLCLLRAPLAALLMMLTNCAGLLVAGSSSDTNRSPDFSLLLPVWNPFYTVTAGVGYKDNVLLSHQGRQGSGFASVGGDVTLWRRPIDDGREFLWVLNAVDRRYWDNESVDHEDWAFSRARYLHDLGESWVWITELDLSYFDVAVDLTYVESAPRGSQLRGGSLGGLTGARWKWESGDWLQLNPVASRTWLSGGFDAYSELGGQVAFQHPYGHKSDWRADYSLKLREYDQRSVVDLAGREVGGPGLHYLRHDATWVLRHYWDERRRWRTTSKLSGLASFDNGSGYYSYWRAAATEQLEYQSSSWSLRVEFGIAYYAFPRQRLSLADTTSRQRSDLVGGLRWEKKLGRLWRLQLEYNWDGALANDDLEAYGANTVQGLVALDF